MEKNVWLITLPHAGGSSTLFKGWNKKINCNIVNVEYPGHWKRMREPLIQSFGELSEDVIRGITARIPSASTLYLYGHSLGAILAWYIAPLLIKKGFKVKKLFLSASQNPGAFPEKSILNSLTDESMLELIGYNAGEHDDDINKQFMNTFFPILKNDLLVCKSFECKENYVDIDADVYYGRQDIFTEVDEIEKWNKFVKIDKIMAFSGGHLFIEKHENADSITELINESIALILEE